MAERIVSPGVFTRERDLSFLPQGISEIGAAIIGPTKKGPAFTPTTINNFQEFEEMFGAVDPRFYVPYTVEAYLRSAGTVTIVRVLGIGGYAADSIQLITHFRAAAGAGSASFSQSLAVLAPSLGSSGAGDFTASTLSGSMASDGLKAQLVVSGSNISAETYSFSFNTGSANYITEVLSEDPQSTKSGGSSSSIYVYKNFKDTNHNMHRNLVALDGGVTASLAVTQNGLNFTGGTTTFDSAGDASDTTWTGNKDYQFARTPYILSQLASGKRENLFRVYTRGQGTEMNTSFKLGILDIKSAADVAGSDFGTFSIQVRVHNPNGSDDDQILEQFDNLTFDPLSSNFFARRIGDRWVEIDSNGKLEYYGDFPNFSKYIRVGDFKNMVKDGTFKLQKTVVPFGFEAPNNPTPGGSNVPTASYKRTQVDANGNFDRNVFYGFDFSNLTSRQYLSPIPATATAGANASMSLDGVISSSGNAAVGSADASELNVSTFTGAGTAVTLTNSAIQQRKFLVPFQFGFDGANPAVAIKTGGDIVNTNTMGFDLSDSAASGSVAYKRAINSISNPDEFDINLLVTPGVIHGLHSTVTNHAISKMEARADAFYVMDATGMNDTIDTVKSTVKTLDTNYAGTYYPWVKIVDRDTNSPVFVPPSVVLPGVISFTDSVAHEWFAPAGLNRGGLTSVTEAKTRLTHAERDDLYENRINPIASFPGQGVVVFGQKTLQSRPSALDRINVRRLLIALRKFIASTSRFLVFEQNTSATRNRFLNIVNPYLEQVQSNSGLSAFRVVMDDTNNTPDVVDRNQLVGQIFIQPTRTAEFIVLDFVVQPTGATFPE
jgi:hypothetical protein